LVISVAEAAAALGVSDDLIYELLATGELPHVQLRRRKLIPRRAVEMVVAQAMTGFDPAQATRALTGAAPPK
jgi:excisionase family DNA binding protein